MNLRFRVAGDNRKSFTLIELLVVLALVAILSVVVVMTLNPAELIKQARDSNRLSDLSTINTALNLFSADVTSGFMGTSTVVYVSIPDNASSTCGSLGLPTLPSGYTYNCVSTANLRNTNGTGWIPVNFQRISSNSPISQLPIDPQNTTSTKYYTYVTGGSWKVIATPESQKYLTTAGTDGGSNIGQFEVGNNMSLAPFTDGLVGWWKFDEGIGTTAADSSGYGNSGVASGTVVVTGKVGQYARSFNGIGDLVSIGDVLNFGSSSQPKSFVAWVSSRSEGTNQILSKQDSAGQYSGYGFYFNGGALRLDIIGTNGLGNDGMVAISGGVNQYSIRNIFTNVAVVYDGSLDATKVQFYVNGVLQPTAAPANNVLKTISNISNSFTFEIGARNGAAYPFDGLIDDVRIYNRALSATEILSLYNSTK